MYRGLNSNSLNFVEHLLSPFLLVLYFGSTANTPSLINV